jgi:hypothetical protein
MAANLHPLIAAEGYRRSREHLVKLIMQTLPNHRRRQSARERYDFVCTMMAGLERSGIAPSVTLSKALEIKSTANKAFYDGALQHYEKYRKRYQKRAAATKVSWIGPDGERQLTDPEEVPPGVDPKIDRWRQISMNKAFK